MIIIDMGSGATCKNDIAYIKRMLDELRKVDSGRHKVVIKWQLFAPETVPYLEPLSPLAFDEAYRYAEALGYKTTASVFDTWALSKLLQYRVPFVKFACRPWVYPLIGVADMLEQKAMVSVADMATGAQLKSQWDADILCCVPKYPTDIEAYEAEFDECDLRIGISDHTENWDLYTEYEPDIYECHYCLDDSTGPDASSFARTPAMLKGVL